ncbi:MAG: Ig-like domain-containing protein [Gemmatimonadales bacterium]
MVLLQYLRLLALSCSILAAQGCGGGDLLLPSEVVSGSLEVVGGDDQIGTPGSVLGDSVVVRLVDTAGNGMAGRSVTWSVTSGGGSVTPPIVTTTGDGRAAAKWTLGPAAGANTLTATVTGGSVVMFTAAALSGTGGGGASATRSSLAVDPASIEAGSGTSTITVLVRDGNGDPVEGATVILRATGGGNSLTQPSGTTGPDGVAVGAFRSAEPGIKTISATVDGSVQVRSTAEITVTDLAAPRVELIEGDKQSAPAGSAVPVRPAVRVLDAQGNAMSGFAITFVVTAGGGSVSGGAQTTNAEGIARVGSWTLGSSAGTNTLEARAGSLAGSPVVFTAEGTSVGSGGVDHFVFRVQPKNVDKDKFFTVEVAMVDAGGAVVPLSGIELYLGLFEQGKDQPSNDRLVGSRYEDTGGGVAVFMIAVSKKGTYQLRALSDELPALGPHGPTPFLFSVPFDVK